jgi:cytidylate kinase
MGMQGSGKSTIGELPAQRLGVPFIDGDSLHSVVNKQLMASGHALPHAPQTVPPPAVIGGVAVVRPTIAARTPGL